MSNTVLPARQFPRRLGPGDPGYERVVVDPVARTVRVGRGVTWDDIDAATAEHGLATPGDVLAPDVALGGGPSHLSRRFGLAIDNLLEAGVALGDGRVVRASADEHPGLFWALRGGGALGAVRSFLFRLHDVGTVVGGPTFWPVEHAAAVLAAYRDFLPAAPRALNGAFTFRTVPFPEDRRVCGILWCHVGTEDGAARAMAPLLDALPEPLLHGVQPLPHSVLRRAFAPRRPRHVDFVEELPDAAVALHARFGAHATLELHPTDGAARDVGGGDTAWSHRGARWCAAYGSGAYHDALRPHARATLDGGWGPFRSDNRDRLAAMRAVYDPDTTPARWS